MTRFPFGNKTTRLCAGPRQRVGPEGGVVQPPDVGVHADGEVHGRVVVAVGHAGDRVRCVGEPRRDVQELCSSQGTGGMAKRGRRKSIATDG